MKRGFTLIELLAVIVILAIIALIAVPIVISIIDDSKKSAEKNSVEMYMKGVETAIAKQNLKSNYDPTTCEIQSDSNLKCFKDEKVLETDNEDNLLEVEMKGKSPSEGTINLNQGNIVSYSNVKFENYFYTKNDDGILTVTDKKMDQATKQFCTLVLDSDNDKKLSRGDKYECEVRKNLKYYFYVISINDDETINLLMDRNLCLNGNCIFNWGEDGKKNEDGPIVAMQNLYEMTKDWTNVSPISFTYSDEEDTESTLSKDNYYGGIVADNGIAQIKGKDGSSILATIGTNINPLRARLPQYKELDLYWDSGGVCDAFVNDNIEMNGTDSYWLASSFFEDNGYAFVVTSDCEDTNYINNNGEYLNSGIRPVIIVSKDNFAN